ncbi:MAG TPA: SLBB domain-containing protein [Gemmatimonadaceae bacterium]|nr:SLBB domain-containing protein [Gemmatimonadaceae bacterium]
MSNWTDISSSRRAWHIAVAIGLASLLARGAHAQTADGSAAGPAAGPAAGSAWMADRAELTAALEVLDASAASTAYSERLRDRAREDAAQVRHRLTAGDFSVGDRIQLRVSGPTQLVDTTLTVGDSLILNVPGIKQVRLYGVLRSELESALTRDLGEVVRQVQVSAHPLIRIAVLGQVTTPGFLAVPPETLVDQLITLSGGPAPTAALDNMSVVRRDTVLWDGDELSGAIARGRTVAALNLRDGDALVVPPQGAPWDRAAVLQIASFFIGPLITILVVR